MGEIKFSVWDKERGRMSLPIHIYDQIIQWTDGDIDMPLPFARDPDRFEWLQYTGLKDKNGVEIYEGDIVRITGHMVDAFAPVIMSMGAWRLDDKNGDGTMIAMWNRCVIGNIYENPELLT